MTPIKDMTTEDRMTRALLVIEGLTLEHDLADKKTLKKIARDVYRIAHAATGKCCTGGVFDQFYKVQEDAEKFLKDANIMDVAKTMKKPAKY